MKNQPAGCAGYPGFSDTNRSWAYKYSDIHFTFDQRLKQAAAEEALLGRDSLIITLTGDATLAGAILDRQFRCR
jgi:hypothetical protein